MVERLEQWNLQEVIIAKKAVRWKEKGREIIINNELFDVESYHMKNDSIVFKGLFDKKETLINKNVDLLIDHENRGSPSTNSIAQMVLQPFYVTCGEYYLCHPAATLALDNDGQQKEKLLNTLQSPVSPPPKQFKSKI